MSYFEDDINDTYMSAQGGQADQLGEVFGQYDYDPSYYDYQDFYDAPPAEPDYAPYTGPSQSYYDNWDQTAPDVMGQYSPADYSRWVGGGEAPAGPDWPTEGQYSPANPEAYYNPTMPQGGGGPTFPNGQQWKPMTPLSTFGSGTGGFRTWDTKTGALINTAGGGGAGAYRGGRNSNTSGLMQGAMQAYAGNQADARQRALADREKALNATNRLARTMNDSSLGQAREAVGRLQKNPYGAEFLNYARSQLRDSRAVAMQTAAQQMAQQYAAMGRPMDPKMLQLLQWQMTLANNGDLRDLMVQTAGLGYQADLNYAGAARNLFGSVLQGETALNDSIYRVLANTEYDTGNQDLAALLALARMGAG
jgi:hypothetical protein